MALRLHIQRIQLNQSVASNIAYRTITCQYVWMDNFCQFSCLKIFSKRVFLKRQFLLRATNLFLLQYIAPLASCRMHATTIILMPIGAFKSQGQQDYIIHQPNTLTHTHTDARTKNGIQFYLFSCGSAGKISLLPYIIPKIPNANEQEI